MSLNTDLIRERSQDILASVTRLERFQGVPAEAFLADQDGLDVASYRLLVAIEAALQLCHHVARERLRQVPGEHAQCFEILMEAALLDAEPARNLQEMACLQNRLIRVDRQVDYREVHAFIQHGLVDLRAFVRAIGELL